MCYVTGKCVCCNFWLLERSRLFLDVLEESGCFKTVLNMSFRRIPFQFSTTDPVQRQAELEKRFGLPGSSMYVDATNPLSVGTGNKEPNMAANSPRLQHRVPIFVEGRDQPIKSSVDSAISSSDCKKKPNVRVIPIEIEGAEARPATRHRTFSGPASWAKGNEETVSQREDGSPVNHSIQDLSEKIKATERPVIRNIPVQIEKSRSEPKNLKSDKAQFNSSREDHPELHGCVASKQAKKVKSPEKEHKAESAFEISLKKIQNVLEELKLYNSDVQKFVGTVKDKQYRYLDEMLTRCMLRLDDIDTMGNEELRSVRKNAVKKVQASIDLLDTKVNPDSKVIPDEFENTAEMHSNGEEAMCTDMKEINAENVVMEEGMASENVESRNSQDQASKVEMTEEAKRKMQSSDVVSHMPSNLTIQRTEVELPPENDLNEREIVESKSDECNPDNVSEVKIDQNMSDASEVEMAEVESLPHNVDPVKINEVCESEMTESKSDLSQNSDVNTILNEISADEPVKTVQNSKETPELDNAATANEITDIEMEDIHSHSMSDALFSEPVKEVTSSQMQRIDDCDKVINNSAIHTSEKEPELILGNALIEKASGTFDPIVNSIYEKIAEVSSEIKKQ